MNKELDEGVDKVQSNVTACQSTHETSDQAKKAKL